MKSKTKAILESIIGSVSTAIGFLGFGCFCTYPLIGTALAALGISMIFLTKYNYLFLIIGITLIIISIFHFHRKHECKTYSKTKKK
ncbi:hypothetical protein HOC35_03940 [Candidatus Woesearchaeota archaeon]|jgi:hypothetical protein|nr:hypothetical protein [Candidatus Woesearchaeota archaeon]